MDALRQSLPLLGSHTCPAAPPLAAGPAAPDPVSSASSSQSRASCVGFMSLFDENELLSSHCYLYWGNIAYKQEAYSLSCKSRLCHPFSRQKIPKSCNQRSVHLIDKVTNKPKLSVNVNRSVLDQFYRYKMPRLIAKVEGKGNEIKTVIVNMIDVAKALNRPPTYPTNILVVNWEHRSSLMLRMSVTLSMDLLRQITCKTCWMDSLKKLFSVLSVRIPKQICMSIQRSKQ